MHAETAAWVAAKKLPFAGYSVGARLPHVRAAFRSLNLKSAFCNRQLSDFSKYAGGHRSRVTPVPIPNTEVKPATADGTAWETVWESRSLPALFLEPVVRNHSGLSFVRRQLN